MYYYDLTRREVYSILPSFFSYFIGFIPDSFVNFLAFELAAWGI